MVKVKAGIPFLLFNDKCEEALCYYTDLFEAKIVEKMTFEDVGYLEDEQRLLCIANSTVKLGNSLFYASDVIKKTKDKVGLYNNQISIWLEINSADEIQQLEQSLLATNWCNQYRCS